MNVHGLILPAFVLLFASVFGPTMSHAEDQLDRLQRIAKEIGGDFRENNRLDGRRCSLFPAKRE